jgi:hypothetical protein
VQARGGGHFDDTGARISTGQSVAVVPAVSLSAVKVDRVGVVAGGFAGECRCDNVPCGGTDSGRGVSTFETLAAAAVPPWIDAVSVVVVEDSMMKNNASKSGWDKDILRAQPSSQWECSAETVIRASNPRLYRP